MNSHCQQYDVAVGLPHTGSDSLRRVRFTVGAHCTLVFDIYVGYTGWLLPVQLAVSLQYRGTFNSVVTSARLLACLAP